MGKLQVATALLCSAATFKVIIHQIKPVVSTLAPALNSEFGSTY
jgi:hypothetical protein